MRAFILAGGAARGSFQVGVLGQLHAKGIFPDVCVGTSAGALNASGIGSIGPIKLAAVWSKIKNWRDLYKVNYGALTGFGDGILSTEPLRELLAANVDPTVKRCKVIVTKTSLATSETVNVSNDDADYLESVEASTAIPFVVRPVNGFVDGGVCCNVPVAQALLAGATEITIILCSPLYPDFTDPWRPSWKWLSGVEVAFRAVDIMEDQLMRDQILQAKKSGVRLTVYAPPAEICGPLDFGVASYERGYAMGLAATPLAL